MSIDFQLHVNSLIFGFICLLYNSTVNIGPEFEKLSLTDMGCQNFWAGNPIV